MINLNDNYYLTRATLDQTKEIVTVVNTAYGEQFNPYLLDTPEQPIARIDEKKIQSYINDPSTELYVLVNKTTQTVSGTIGSKESEGSRQSENEIRCFWLCTVLA